MKGKIRIGVLLLLLLFSFASCRQIVWVPMPPMGGVKQKTPTK